MHAADVDPGPLPKVPAGQLVHTPAPDTLYVPDPHTLTAGDVDPAGHQYPAVQLPEQLGDDRPVVAPKVPAGQGAVQAAIVSPVLAPYTPAGQGEHTPAPAREYCPAGHSTAVALVLPGGQACPAEHWPEHAAVVKALAAPKTPAGQGVHTAATVPPGL